VEVGSVIWLEGAEQLIYFHLVSLLATVHDFCVTYVLSYFDRYGKMNWQTLSILAYKNMTYNTYFYVFYIVMTHTLHFMPTFFVVVFGGELPFKLNLVLARFAGLSPSHPNLLPHFAQIRPARTRSRAHLSLAGRTWVEWIKSSNHAFFFQFLGSLVSAEASRIFKKKNGSNSKGISRKPFIKKNC
jgi:hypothetical protein